MKYVLRRSSRTKRLRVTIKPGGTVVVSAPIRLSQKSIDQFVQEHAEWISKKVQLAKERPRSVLDAVQTGFSANRARAKKLAQERVRHFADIYGVSYNTIRIKNHSSQWGSCSTKKNLNFNYRLVFLPPDLVDYIVVHEVCHLLEMNHSPSFWRLVSASIPDYRQKIQALKSFHF